MPTRFTSFCAVLLGAALLLAGPLAGAAEQRLVLTGSSTIAPLAAEIGKRFEKLNPGVRVDVQACPRSFSGCSAMLSSASFSAWAFPSWRRATT